MKIKKTNFPKYFQNSSVIEARPSDFHKDGSYCDEDELSKT